MLVLLFLGCEMIDKYSFPLLVLEHVWLIFFYFGIEQTRTSKYKHFTEKIILGNHLCPLAKVFYIFYSFLTKILYFLFYSWIIYHHMDVHTDSACLLSSKILRDRFPKNKDGPSKKSKDVATAVRAPILHIVPHNSNAAKVLNKLSCFASCS